MKLFGATTVITDAEPMGLTDFGGGKPREILEILAVAGGAPVAKDRLAELLWDGAPPRSYVATLESYISVLRKRLGCTPGRRSEIATTTQGYRLDPATVEVDLVTFRALAREVARASVEESLRLVEQALALLGSGDLLASEPSADWAERERTAFKADLIRLADQGATRALEVADHESAARFATVMTQSDPVNEVGWQRLMQARWGAGRRSDALRAYGELRTVLTAELGVDPSAQVRALYLEILRDEPAAGPWAGEQRLELATLTGLLQQCLETMGSGGSPTADRYLADAWSRAQRGLAELELALNPVTAARGLAAVRPAAAWTAA